MDSSFWSRFKSENWNLSPLVTAKAPRIPVAAVFQAVLRVPSAVRSDPTLKRLVRLSVGGETVETPQGLESLLPRRSDESFEGYHRRIARENPGCDYGLIINALHRFDPKLWALICQELKPFYETIGIPLGGMEAVLFAGNYERTSFGVHRDEGNGFQLPLIGTKKIRLWTRDYVERHPELKGAKEFRKHLAHSRLLEGRPGELLYWPSDRWHIGEGSGQFGVSLALPMLFRDVNVIWQVLNQHYQSWRGEAAAPRSYLQTIEAQIAECRALLDSTELNQKLTRGWLNHYSAYGFNYVPPRPRRTPLHKKFSVDPVFPVLWTPVPGQKQAFYVACRGHSEILKNAPFLPELIRSLKDYHSVEEVLKAFPGRNVSEALRTIHSLGGISAPARTSGRESRAVRSNAAKARLRDAGCRRQKSGPAPASG